MVSLENGALEFDPAISVADKEAGSTNSVGSLHGWKEFAMASLMQIFDMGTSDIVRSNDMKPKFIISIIS